MTPSQQAALEQMAREFLGIKPMATPFGEELEKLNGLIKIFADTERAVLEEVAGETRRFTSVGAVAQWCRQQAKERS